MDARAWRGECSSGASRPGTFATSTTGYEPALQTFAHDTPLSFIRLRRISQIVTPIQGCLCALGVRYLSGDAAAARCRHRPGHPGRETPAVPSRKAATGGETLAGDLVMPQGHHEADERRALARNRFGCDDPVWTDHPVRRLQDRRLRSLAVWVAWRACYGRAH